MAGEIAALRDQDYEDALEKLRESVESRRPLVLEEVEAEALLRKLDGEALEQV